MWKLQQDFYLKILLQARKYYTELRLYHIVKKLTVKML